jgi:nitroreductase
MPRVKPQVPPRELIDRIITAAVWAPNHFKTEPWRFIVIGGPQRELLGDVMAESLRARIEDPDTEEARLRLEKERAKPLRAPLIIAVAAAPSNRPRVVEEEEICAVAAGVQNMLLAAEALELGAMWRTGEPARDPAVKRFLGLPASAHIIAFVYVGYPDLPAQPRPNRDATPYITWRDQA